MQKYLFIALFIGLVFFGCVSVASLGNKITDSVVFGENDKYLKTDRVCNWDGTFVICEGAITNLGADVEFSDLKLQLTVEKPRGSGTNCLLCEDSITYDKLGPNEKRSFNLKCNANSQQEVRAVLHTYPIILDCS